MAVLGFRREAAMPGPASAPRGAALGAFLAGHSLEVMPRTSAKVPDFATLLPRGTRVYVAHIAGTPIEEMVATAARLRAEGMEPMPHFPARIVPDRRVLDDWIARYRGEADVRQGLVLAGGVPEAVGAFTTSMDLLGSGAFDGFERLHIAGHPEGNRDIDPDGSVKNVSEALSWKQKFSERTDTRMAIATQFCFEAAPVVAWARSLRDAGIDLPVHIGIAGPAKLQTLINFAIACGVGPSLRVLQRRAADVTKLLTPYEPTEFVADLAQAKAADPTLPIEAVHVFPLGGIEKSAAWLATHSKDEE
jgi:methylenetetrahydrofolate reductase (NADPH)